MQTNDTSLSSIGKFSIYSVLVRRILNSLIECLINANTNSNYNICRPLVFEFQPLPFVISDVGGGRNMNSGKEYVVTNHVERGSRQTLPVDSGKQNGHMAT